MNEQIEEALAQDRTIDITTVGRRSGKRRRLEIWFHNVDGRLFITGTPGTRDWYANLVANPEFTFHLKQSAQADIPARAEPIRDEDERRQIMAAIHNTLEGEQDLEAWVAGSPLVKVHLQEG